MKAFLLPLQGPMQSYGDSGFLSLREAGPFPSRSAVLGILAAALGIRRNHPDLIALHEALRVHVVTLDAGTPMVDYHTVEPKDWHDPDAGEVSKVQTYRTYHHDAAFLALIEAVEGGNSWLDRARDALHNPVFVGYLGRRACPPAEPLLPRKAPDGPSPEAVLLVAAEAEAAAHEEMRRERWWRRLLRLPDELDVYVEGHREAIGVVARAAVHGFRRDRLVALPRHYVKRPMTHFRVQRSPSPNSEDLSNAAFFDAASSVDDGPDPETNAPPSNTDFFDADLD